MVSEKEKNQISRKIRCDENSDYKTPNHTIGNWYGYINKILEQYQEENLTSLEKSCIGDIVRIFAENGSLLTFYYSTEFERL